MKRPAADEKCGIRRAAKTVCAARTERVLRSLLGSMVRRTHAFVVSATAILLVSSLAVGSVHQAAASGAEFIDVSATIHPGLPVWWVCWGLQGELHAKVHGATARMGSWCAYTCRLHNLTQSMGIRPQPQNLFSVIKYMHSTRHQRPEYAAPMRCCTCPGDAGMHCIWPLQWCAVGMTTMGAILNFKD